MEECAGLSTKVHAKKIQLLHYSDKGKKNLTVHGGANVSDSTYGLAESFIDTAFGGLNDI